MNTPFKLNTDLVSIVKQTGTSNRQDMQQQKVTIFVPNFNEFLEKQTNSRPYQLKNNPLKQAPAYKRNVKKQFKKADSSKITLSSFAIDLPADETESFFNHYGTQNQTPFRDRTATQLQNPSLMHSVTGTSFKINNEKNLVLNDMSLENSPAREVANIKEKNPY